MSLMSVAERWNQRCAYCDCIVSLRCSARLRHAATCDHFIPRTCGGDRSERNTVLACRQCNQLKGAIDPRRLLWVWLQVDPHGLAETLGAYMNSTDAAATPPELANDTREMAP